PLSPMASILTVCRRHLPWPNSRRAWEELAATLGLLTAAVALWWLGGALLPVAQVLLWSVLVVVAAVLLRRGWLKLFGPVLFYDMVRSARLGRYPLMRLVYAGLLFVQLVWIYNVMMWQPHRQQYLDPLEAARIAQTEFEVVMAVQLVAVLVLTPAY